MWHVQDWKLGLNSVLVGMDWRTTLVLVIALYVVYEQLSYISKRKHLPGPLFVLPFIGNVIAMVVDPTRFWDQQAVAARKVSRMAMTFSMSVLLERSVSFSVSSIFKMRTFHSDESLHIYTHELVHLGTLKFLTDSLSLGFFPLGIAINFFGSQKSGQVNRNGSCGCRWECLAMLINGFVVRKNCLFIFL